MEEIPAIVLELGSRAKGNPIAWKEYPDGWTIVFEDGRKLQFKRKGETPSPALPQMAPEEHRRNLGEGASRLKKKGGSQA